jgi:hypothetical protein
MGKAAPVCAGQWFHRRHGDATEQIEPEPTTFRSARDLVDNIPGVPHSSAERRDQYTVTLRDLDLTFMIQTTASSFAMPNHWSSRFSRIAMVRALCCDRFAFRKHSGSEMLTVLTILATAAVFGDALWLCPEAVVYSLMLIKPSMMCGKAASWHRSLAHCLTLHGTGRTWQQLDYWYCRSMSLLRDHASLQPFGAVHGRDAPHAGGCATGW